MSAPNDGNIPKEENKGFSEAGDIHKAIALEILEEMKKGKDISTILNKDKIMDLIEKVKEKGAPYYLCHLDTDKTNGNVIKNFTEHERLLFKALVKELKDQINFDVVFYKYGKKCDALKKRHAVIFKNRIFSSRKDFREFNEKKAKEKTELLKGSIVYEESKNQSNITKSEWLENDKPYRLRIFIQDPRFKDKKDKYKNIFMYFPNQEQMKEVEDMLFGIKQGKDLEIVIIRNLKDVQKVVEGSYIFYGMLKMLAVKARIKKRKIMLKALKDYSEQSYGALTSYINSESIQKIIKTFIRKKTTKVEIKKSEDSPKAPTKEAPTKPEPEAFDGPYGYNFNPYFPVITKVCDERGVIKPQAASQKEGVDLISGNEAKVLKNFINNVLPEKERKPTAFLVKGCEYQGNIDEVNGVKEIKVNKVDPKVTFCNDSREELTLDSDKIGGISNVVYNGNIEMNETTKNSLVLFGPKTDQDSVFMYEYKNRDDRFIDPEKVGLKFSSSGLPENDKKDLYVLQILQMIYYLPPSELKEIEKTTGGNKITDPMNDLYFYLTVTLSDTKTKYTKLYKPSVYKDNHVIVEYNKDFLISPIHLENDNKSSIVVRSYAIPRDKIDSFEGNQKDLLLKYLASEDLGNISINEQSVRNGKTTYIIEKRGRPVSDSSMFHLQCVKKFLKASPDAGFTGKDYSIGSDMYLEGTLTEELIEKARQNPKLSSQYQNIRCDSSGDIFFRPPENMTEEDFKNDILKYVDEETVEGILYNDQFKFLPQCEKITSKEQFEESSNLKAIPDDERAPFRNYDNEWVYKCRKVKARVLTKNMGITDEKEAVQLNYLTDQEEEPIRVSSLKNPIFTPITEDTFNVLDMNDLKEKKCINWDNFDWAILIQFNSQLQSETFVRTLRTIREKANLNKLKKAKSSDKEGLRYEELLYEGSEDSKNSYDYLNLKIDCIELRQNYDLQEDSELNVIAKKGNAVRLGDGNSLLEALDQREKYGFENSLLQNPKILEALKKSRGESKPEEFDPGLHKPRIEKEKFNKGQKKLIMGKKMKAKFQYIPTLDKYFEIEINFRGRKEQVLFSPLNVSECLENGAIEKIFPIYQNDINGKIFGMLHLKCWRAPANNPELTFEEAYSEAYKRELESFRFKDDDDVIIPKGKYEPNIFKRKILKEIHNKFGLDSNEIKSQIGYDNELRNLFFQFLETKCVLHPEFSDLGYFEPENIMLNLYPNNSYGSSYIIKLIKKIIKYRNRRDFYNLFSNREWKFFLQGVLKEEIDEKDDDIFLKLKKEDIFKNTELLGEFRNLMYLGFYSERRRQIVWEKLLDIEKIFQLTREHLNKESDNDYSTKEEIFKHYQEEVQNGQKDNIIFSLIDNDTNYIARFKKEDSSDFNNENLKTIEKTKEIAKAFYLWTEEKISLNKSKADTKYVYFAGVLNIIQRLYLYFSKLPDFINESNVFWLIVGLSQYVELFQQVNPLYSEDMSYINLYFLVTKLILECHNKEIYDKVLALNFPFEQFISQHMSALYSDYFQSDLLFRFFDVLIIEATYGYYKNDPLQYLRILCAVPVTLFSINRKKVIECQSVSELQTVADDFVVKTYNAVKFITLLKDNVEKYYVYNNIFEKWLGTNKDIKWDEKRDTIQTLIYRHFRDIQSENLEYLKNISLKDSTLGESQTFVDNYFKGIENKLDKVRNLYDLGTPDGVPTGNSPNGILFHITRISSAVSKKDALKASMILNLTFSKSPIKKGDYLENAQSHKVTYDTYKGTILNIGRLLFTEKFDFSTPKYANFRLETEEGRRLADFSYEITRIGVMEIKKVILESKDEDDTKIMMELSVFKFTTKPISSDDLALFNSIFAQPEYKHNIEIEDNFSGIPITNKKFINSIKTNIKNQNDSKSILTTSQDSQFKEEETICEIFNNKNIIKENKDEYTNLIEKFWKPSSKNSDNNFTKLITGKVEDLLKNTITEESQEIVMRWLKEKNISFEEVLYGLVFIDKSSNTIYEKMYLLFSIAQMKNRLLFNSEKASIEKVKELFYAIYKRFMIYFTKNDIDRMVDFAIKDERLMNFKYVLVYSNESESNASEIDQIIFDKDRYTPISLKESKFSYDDITKEFNVYINHLINHYNLKTITKEMMEVVLSDIIENNKEKSKQYKEKMYNRIRIQISSDNIDKKVLFELNTSNYKVTAVADEQISIDNDTDVVASVICKEAETFNLQDTFTEKDEISFTEFKRIFFTLPFISDLLRIGCVFISEDKEKASRTYDLLKVSIKCNNEVISNIYFPEPRSIQDSSIQNIYANSSAESSMTVKSLVDKLFKNIHTARGNDQSKGTKLEKIEKYLCYPECFRCYVVNKNDGTLEEILFFENLYSNLYLKNVSEAELLFVINETEISIRGDEQIVEKKSGYAKFYLTQQNDFEWRKCKVYEDENIVQFNCFDHKTKIKLGPKDKFCQLE